MIVSCRSGVDVTPAHVEVAAAVGEPVTLGSAPSVPFIRLIARPESYHGKQVQVVGYMNLEFEGNALYPSEEQYRHSDVADAIWIDVEGMKAKPPFKRGWVIIEGRFNGERRGHFGLFAGTLEAITRLEPWK